MKRERELLLDALQKTFAYLDAGWKTEDSDSAENKSTQQNMQLARNCGSGCLGTGCFHTVKPRSNPIG